MVMSHHGVSSYMTGGDTYSLPYRPVSASADSMLHRYHTAIDDEGWKKPKPKKSNVALSALVLLSFLFFLHILQSCVEDHMRDNKDHHHHGHHPYYYQNYSYQWPVWQVAARANLQTPRTQSVDEVYDESQDYTSEDSIEPDNGDDEPIERFLPDFHQARPRINSKKQESVNEQDVQSMEKLAPIVDSKKLN